MSEEKIRPIPYLDTNVILDFIRKRNDHSEYLLHTILRRKIKCWTSYYTILELLDRTQESQWIHRRTDEGASFDDILRKRYPRGLTKPELKASSGIIEKKFLTPFVATDIIGVKIPEPEGWDDILELLTKQNFSIADAFHVHAAIGSGCNVFISNDSDLVGMINKEEIKNVNGTTILATSAENLEKKLSDAGMMPIVS